jgi:1-acyl-sn-glycerol-3-phosphate acyltransferase
MDYKYFYYFRFMNWLFKPFVIIYRLYFVIVFFGVLLILYPVFWLFLLNKEKPKRAVKLKVFTAKLILIFLWIRTKNVSKSKLTLQGPFVICPNHGSYLDILTMYTAFNRHRFLFIGKKELLTWPIINIFFKNIDIAIDRNKPREAIKSLEKAKNQLKNKWSIGIFPEGIIPLDAPKISPFKNGAFKIAIETQTPILPVTFLDNWRLFQADPVVLGKARPGLSRFIIHEPISTKGMTEKDLVSLREQVYEIVNKPLLEYHSKALK